MSASPAQPTSGPNSVTPTTGGPPAPVVRKKPAVNIFNSKKKSAKRPHAPAQQKPNAPPVVSNGQAAQAPTNGIPQAVHAADDPNSYEEYPIFINKNSIFSGGQRFHAAKLHTRNNEKVNPFDEKAFVRPLRLHRRFARDKMALEQSDAEGLDDKDREQVNARRLERQAEREENQKLIAPTGGDSSKPTKKKPMKKVEEGRDNSDPKRQKRQQLRYEESRPWHLEDFEGKNIWVGSYEAALSEQSMMFQIADSGFHAVPIEKWYRFTQTNKVNAMDSEEAEKHMNKKFNVGRWALKTHASEDQKREEEMMMRRKMMRAARDEDDEPKFADTGDFQADRDLLDMEFNDEFQDDDEGMLFQGEDGEDGKEIEERLRLEMREAGLGGTGVKDEELDPYEEERKKQQAELEEAKKQRRAKKLLRKNEHQGQYDTDDSDRDPYADSEDTEDSEEERQREEEQKKDDAKKLLNGDKSGASSRGTNTPSGRPEKRSKRPGSPDASEASGNESSRKRIKGANGNVVSAPSAGAGGARSLSPATAKASRPGAGSGSDTDTSRKDRSKLKVKGSPSGSPSSDTPTGSRAASPAPPKEVKPFPTLDEVRAAIPTEGVEVKTLIATFRARIGKKNTEFIALVKQAGRTGAGGKIVPK